MRRAGYVAIYFKFQHAADMSKVVVLAQAMYAYRIWIITQMKSIPLCFVVVRKTRNGTHLND